MILDEIMKYRARQLEREKAACGLEEMQKRVEKALAERKPVSLKAALRQDTVRNLLCGLAELALLWMGVMLVTADGFFPALLGMLLLCVTAAFFQNFWAVQAAVDIPFAAAAKNAWLLCLLRPGMTVLGLGVNALLLIPAVLFFPLSLPYVLLFPCGLSGFASGMIGWSSCKRYLIR